jgi:hypothetical protein
LYLHLSRQALDVLRELHALPHFADDTLARNESQVFPKSVHMSAGEKAWRTSELTAWQKDPELWKKRQ